MKLIVKLIMLLAFVVPSFADDESDVTYESLMAGASEFMVARTEPGVIREIDLTRRTIEISGYIYYVAPSWSVDTVSVQLLGTTAGSFEMLRADMPIEVTYYEFGIGRVATAIKEVDESVEVEF